MPGFHVDFVTYWWAVGGENRNIAAIFRNPPMNRPWRYLTSFRNSDHVMWQTRAPQTEGSGCCCSGFHCLFTRHFSTFRYRQNGKCCLQGSVDNVCRGVGEHWVAGVPRTSATIRLVRVTFCPGNLPQSLCRGGVSIFCDGKVSSLRCLAKHRSNSPAPNR